MENNQDVLEFNIFDEIIHEALKNGDTLATPQESQMLINMTGVSISTKPRRDGRYQGYVIVGGSKQYFYGKSREEVAVKIKTFLQEAKTPKKKSQKKNSPTFGEYVQNWIETYKKPNLKPSSMVSLTSSLKPAIEKFSTYKLDKLSTDDIQRLLLSIKGTRIRDICRSNLNQIFKKARIQGIIKINPCEALELKTHKYTHKNALTKDEQARFIVEAEKTKYALLYKLLLATGLRIGEALALTATDVDTENNTVSVSKNVVFINGARIEQNTPKTGAGNRTVPVPAEICNELKALKSDPLFPFTYNAIHHSMISVSANIGIKVTPHILRHTYATRLEEAGIPPKIKQFLMGHATLHMTQDVYTDTQADYVQTLSEKIRSLF